MRILDFETRDTIVFTKVMIPLYMYSIKQCICNYVFNVEAGN